MSLKYANTYKGMREALEAGVISQHRKSAMAKTVGLGASSRQGIKGIRGRVRAEGEAAEKKMMENLFKRFETASSDSKDSLLQIEKLKSDLGGGSSEEDVIDVSPSAEAADQEFVKVTIPEYPVGLSQKKIQSIIKSEASLRNISTDSALAIYKAEGSNSYQSSITEGSQKKVGGREASYGPFQLYVGGGLGNEYEEQTGRSLSLDNTLEGITKQIQFALDKAAEGKSWKPWSGHEAAGLDPTEGLNNAKPIFNWRENS